MAVGSTKRTIINQGRPIILDEDKAATALTPGYLVDYDANGYKLQSTASKNVPKTVVIERDEINKDIDAAYAIGDQVKVAAFGGGMRALLCIPSGSNVAKGDGLSPDGYGRVVAASSNPWLCRAVEAVNNTNGNGNSPISANGTGLDARILVEFV